MFSFIIRRFFHLIPTFLGATLLAFMISQLVPGDFFSTMSLNPDVKDIFAFTYDDFTLSNYNCHDAIKAPIAV